MSPARIVAAINTAALGSIDAATLSALLTLSLSALLTARAAFLASQPPDSTALVPSRRLICALYLTLHHDRD